ncbi:MAG: HAD family hydrolase [Candidatus Sericytochromatia bacterium]|nr:HAD family hydrolase [Candidatus Sericytochromatia bacterium]
MHYRLIATDLDGTLFAHQPDVPERTRGALARWVASGRSLVIATGRMYHSTKRVAEQLGVETPLICYQGAMIRCPLTERTLWHQTVAPQPARELIDDLESQGLTVLAFRQDQVHTRVLDEATRAYTSLSRTEARVIPGWDWFLQEGSPTKLVAIGEPARVSRELGRLRPAWAGLLHIVQSQPNFLEVVHPEANKGAALRHLCQHMDIAMEAVIAIGDGQNDLEMVQEAGLGVAMGNAHPDLSRVADCQIGHVADQGIVAFIEGLLADPGRASRLPPA